MSGSAKRLDSQKAKHGRLKAVLADPRGLVTQVFIVFSLTAVIWFLADNTVENLRARGITTGFAFLWRPTSLPIPNSWLEYSAGVSTYGRAITIGFLNTLTVSFIVIVLSTFLGTFVGIGRLSPNWLMSRSCGAYVEALRNVPVLLQLLFWYQLLLQLPPPKRALNPVDGIFVSNRGIRFPALEPDPWHMWIGLALAFGIGATIWLSRWSRRRRERIGNAPAIWPLTVVLIVLLPFSLLQLSGASTAVQVPQLLGFDFRGGGALTPELSALVIGLTIYSSAFVAEIVRAGILAVPGGQWEAARSLGLRNGTTLRKIVLPQALRIIVPPITSEYLGIIKNSSLAVAVGYPDLVAVVTTMLSDTGQAVEGVAIIMLAFLAVSLCVSLFMNWYNVRVALMVR